MDGAARRYPLEMGRLDRWSRSFVQIYLPIAEMPVNFFLLIALGAAVGFISGLFGVGGGFLLTPLLIFIGVPSAVAVASQAPQIVGSSLTGVLSYWRKRAFDLRLSGVLILGSLIGSVAGVLFFNVLRAKGQLDSVIVVSYVVLLGGVGLLMLGESVRAALAARRGGVEIGKHNAHIWYEGLPLKMRFPRSGRYFSVIPLMFVTIGVGFLGAVLGVGGGFIMVPALIYMFRIPPHIVVSASLAQVLFSMMTATVFHAGLSRTVDVALAFALIIGAVFGAQFGARAGVNLRGEYFRLMLALMLFGVSARFAIDILQRPQEPFSVSETETARIPSDDIVSYAPAIENDSGNLTISLSAEKIAISSNFTGASQVVFGAFSQDVACPEPIDVAIVVRGPRGAVVVREKQRMGPVWLNADFRKYIAIPAFLSILTNRPLERIASDDLRVKNLLGLDYLVTAQPMASLSSDLREPQFRAALIRLRERQGLFKEKADGVRFLSPAIFRADARIPGAAPLGAYVVDVAAFCAHNLIAQKSAGFHVLKSGVEEQVASAARYNSWTYGLATVLFALFCGWIASQIFRRD